MNVSVERIRQDFPILSTKMNGKPLVYLDNGATTQKPQCVIDAITEYYSTSNANIHRGLYELSQRATDQFEAARKQVAEFINAPKPAECIFVRGTTEAINLVAQCWGVGAFDESGSTDGQLQPGDEVLVSGLEHHSNIVPWQIACAKTGAKLVVVPGEDDGSLNVEQFAKALSDQTKMVAIQHVSNALGSIHDAKQLIELAKAKGAAVLVDGAQWVAHGQTDVQELGCDFYTFSAHKLFGPTGIGVLWGKESLLNDMPPYQGGGDMIDTVTFDETTYAPLPNKFEAGTPDIAGVIGLAAAIQYVNEVGLQNIVQLEDKLLAYATEQLKTVPGLTIWGNAEKKAAVISFTLDKPSIASMDIANALSLEGIAVRSGHHCCMPLMHQLGIAGTTRISMAFYNTAAEIDKTVEVLNALVAKRQARVNQQGNSDPGTASASTAQDDTDPEAAAISFAPGKAKSVAAAAAELAEEFLEFDDTESKTELLMELGEALPDQFEQLKQLTTAVPGCMSEVYLLGRPTQGDATSFELAADSNAVVVRGLIAVLAELFSGQSAEEILEFDIEEFFRRIGLDQFVSTQRRSGLNGMIQRIRTLASSITERQS